MITLGLVQAAATGNTADNFNTLKKYAQEAADKNCAAVCFPEAFLTGYAPERVAELAIPVSSPWIEKTRALACSLQLDLLVGFMESGDEAFYITHGIFYQDGTMDVYRKTHLGEKEARFFHAGDSLPVYTLSCGLKAGFQICVETHFPEFTQTLSLRGAQVVFAPHAVPRVARERKYIWNLYIPARSFDNRVYMACCNLYDDKYSGGCFASGPDGSETASCFEEKEALLCFFVDQDSLYKYHHGPDTMRYRYYPGKRRTELYD